MTAQIITYLLCPLVLFIGIIILSPRLPALRRQGESGFRCATPILLRGLPWILPLAYAVVFGLMVALKYRSFHTTILDLGVFDQKVWEIAYGDELYQLAFGHFQPILYFYALLYKLWPSALILTLVQTLAVASGAYPLYLIALKHLRDNRLASVPLIAYLLYSPVEYNTLFDFHADHLLIPLMLWGFYFLEMQNAKSDGRSIRRGYSTAFVLISLACLLIKEPLMLSVAMLGLYAVVRHRMYRPGFFIFVFSLFAFFFITRTVIPQCTGEVYGGRFEGTFDYLGSSIPEIVRTLIHHPALIVTEAMDLLKLGYLFLLFAPLLFIPLLSPLELLPALPILLISLLSHLPNYYGITHHYTASVIPGAFVALIYGIEKLQRADPLLTTSQPQCEARSAKCGIHNALYALRSMPYAQGLWFRFSRGASWGVLALSLYYNVVLSPSPLSLAFWIRKDRWLYHRRAYIITQRDRLLDEAIRKYVPSDPGVSVCSQNSVNTGHLAHRRGYYPFPARMDTVDYIVLDIRRPHFVVDRIGMEEEYHTGFKEASANREVIFQEDGIYILGPTLRTIPDSK